MGWCVPETARKPAGPGARDDARDREWLLFQGFTLSTKEDTLLPEYQEKNI